MNASVRYRPARSFQWLDDYGFAFAWPLIFTLPYGWWTWVLAALPSALTAAHRHLWRRRAPREATAQRSGSSVALVDGGGRRVEGFDDGEVAGVTSIVDAKRKSVELRVDRQGKRALVFAASDGDDAATVARHLGIDLQRARSRYIGTSLPARRLVVPFLIAAACMLYALFGSPEAETAVWLLRVNRFVFLPLVVLFSVPTAVDVGRDGVAWRWLFIRRYVSFASLLSMAPIPANARGQTVHSMTLTTRAGEVVHLPLGKRAGNAAGHLLEAFAASREAVAATPGDTWLPREAAESAAAWIQRLRAKSAAGGTYRGTEVRHLWPLAEDPATANELRCAMLLVLATTDEARERTRALAAQVVDPDVRAVFEAIARREPDERIAVLLERVSTATLPTRSRSSAASP